MASALPRCASAEKPNAVETAGRSIRDLRVAEATRFDVTIKDGYHTHADVYGQ